jgi:hypothetical protein
MNEIKIDYTALSLTIPERVRFKYKLDSETKWQPDSSGARAPVHKWS